MSSTAAGDVLPALPPIRTAASQAPAQPACSSAASSSTVPAPDAESVAFPAPRLVGAAGDQDQAPEPSTPTSEATRLRAPGAEAAPSPAAGGQDQAAAEPTTPTPEGSRPRAPGADSAASPASGGQDQAAAEPTTPTSEGSRLRAPAECPPAPRKPAWAPPATPPAAMRKFPSSAAPSARRAFFPVARDLTTVFRALPPKKRIRAG